MVCMEMAVQHRPENTTPHARPTLKLAAVASHTYVFVALLAQAVEGGVLGFGRLTDTGDSLIEVWTGSKLPLHQVGEVRFRKF